MLAYSPHTHLYIFLYERGVHYTLAWWYSMMQCERSYGGSFMYTHKSYDYKKKKKTTHKLTVK